MREIRKDNPDHLPWWRDYAIGACLGLSIFAIIIALGELGIRIIMG